MLPVILLALLSMALPNTIAAQPESKKTTLFSLQDLMQAQKNAASWATQTVQSTGQNSVLLANLLLTAHEVAVTDNAVRKQLPVIVALTNAIVVQARNYTDSSHYRTLLTQLLTEHKESLARRDFNMALWQACDTYIHNQKNATLEKAFSTFQTQSQELLESHIQSRTTDINKHLLSHHKACQEDAAIIYKVAELAELLSQDKLPEEMPQEGNIFAKKAHVINDLSTYLQDRGINLFTTADQLATIIIDMQDASSLALALYYNALYAALEKAGYAKNARIMFNAKGLIPAAEKSPLLPKHIGQ